jgi:ribose 1,5-bisphosphate isomerase
MIHPEMESIKTVIKSLEECKKRRIKEKNDYIAYFDVITDRIKIKEEITSNNLAKELQKCNSFMTLSYSSTILEACKLIPEISRNKLIYVLESRSKREGILQAKRLAELGYEVRLIVDAAANYYANKVGLFVIGADTIFSDGAVLNKVGSLQLALVAKYNRKPILVAASTNKISSKTSEEHAELIEEKPSDDIFKSELKNLKVKNIYFEIIPAKLISKIISDEDWRFFIKK